MSPAGRASLVAAWVRSLPPACWLSRHPSPLALQAWFDGEATESVAWHVASCDECFEAARELSWLRSALRGELAGRPVEPAARLVEPAARPVEPAARPVEPAARPLEVLAPTVGDSSRLRHFAVPRFLPGARSISTAGLALGLAFAASAGSVEIAGALTGSSHPAAVQVAPAASGATSHLGGAGRAGGAASSGAPGRDAGRPGGSSTRRGTTSSSAAGVALSGPGAGSTSATSGSARSDGSGLPGDGLIAPLALALAVPSPTGTAPSATTPRATSPTGTSPSATGPKTPASCGGLGARPSSGGSAGSAVSGSHSPADAFPRGSTSSSSSGTCDGGFAMSALIPLPVAGSGS